MNYNSGVWRTAFWHFLMAEANSLELRGYIHSLHPSSCQTLTLKAKLSGWGGHAAVLRWNVTQWLKVHTPEQERTGAHLRCQHVLSRYLTSYLSVVFSVVFNPWLMLMWFMALFAIFKLACIYYAIRTTFNWNTVSEYCDETIFSYLFSSFWFTKSPSLFISFSLATAKIILIVGSEGPSIKPNTLLGCRIFM